MCGECLDRSNINTDLQNKLLSFLTLEICTDLLRNIRKLRAALITILVPCSVLGVGEEKKKNNKKKKSQHVSSV